MREHEIEYFNTGAAPAHVFALEAERLGVERPRLDAILAQGASVGYADRPAVARGDGKGSVSIDYVPTIEPVEPFDTLVSSGTDGLYPRGLEVGRVATVRRNKTLFWEIQVSAAADPHRESLVFVLPPVRKPDVTTGPSGAERR